MADLVHRPTKHKCTCCYIASVGHTVAYGCNGWLGLSVVVWYVVYAPQTLCGGIALAPWQQLRGLAHRPGWHICSWGSVVCTTTGERKLGLGHTTWVLCAVYVSNTLYQTNMFALRQLQPGSPHVLTRTISWYLTRYFYLQFTFY